MPAPSDRGWVHNAYQERYTAATILSALGAGVAGGAISADTPHLTFSFIVKVKDLDRRPPS